MMLPKPKPKQPQHCLLCYDWTVLAYCHSNSILLTSFEVAFIGAGRTTTKTIKMRNRCRKV